MYVGTGVESLYHVGVAAYVGYQTQFYLRIVGRQQYVAGFGNESPAYLTTFVSADRYVLQIGVGR